MIFIFIFPLIGVLCLGGAYIYTKTDTKRKKRTQNVSDVNNNVVQPNADPKKISELQKLIGINDIKNSKIKMRNGSLRVILGISSSDFELLTEDEQKNMEDCLIQFSLALSNPIQFFTTPSRVETKDPARDIENLINSSDEEIPSKLKEHASRLLTSLKKVESERGVYVRRSFCVIGTDILDEKRALHELQHRVSVVISKLSRAKMRVSILDSVQITQLLTDIMEKGSNILVSQLQADGILDLYSEGSGRIVYEEFEEEEKEENNGTGK